MTEKKYTVTSRFCYEDEETGKVKATLELKHFDCNYRHVVDIEKQMQTYLDGLFQMGRKLADGIGE